jgi:hypothetical protein
MDKADEIINVLLDYPVCKDCNQVTSDDNPYGHFVLSDTNQHDWYPIYEKDMCKSCFIKLIDSKDKMSKSVMTKADIAYHENVNYGKMYEWTKLKMESKK